MNIFSYLLDFYIVLAISVIAHELFHFFAALIFKFKNTSLFIGDDFFSINIKRIHISPLLIKGYVEFDFEKKPTYKFVVFFLSGSIANLIIIILSLVLKGDYFYYFLFINVFSIIVNLFPIKYLKNDFGSLMNCIKQSKKL